MFHSILVPLDGSTLAEQALPLAAAAAERNNASLSLAVVHPWGPAEDAPRPGTRADRELREAEGIYLNRLMQAVGSAYRIPVCEALLDGATGLALVEFARRRDVDLVIASTHDHGVVGHFLSGGVAHHLAHQVHASALFIKPQAGPLSISPGGFRRILVALDGSARAEAAIGPAAALASRDAVLTLVGMVSERGQLLEQHRADAASYFEELVPRLEQQHGLTVRTAILVATNPAAAIVGYAEAVGMDLIALTTRARRLGARTLFGSTADATIHKSAVPVLVCHAPAVTPARTEASVDALGQ